MRLNPTERAHVRRQIEHFSSVIQGEKNNKKSVSDIFETMLAYESAQATDMYREKQLDDMKIEDERSTYDYAAASKTAALTYISGIYAMEYELSKRTWKDYLFHPFRSIAERISFNNQKENAQRKYSLSDEDFNSVMDNLAEINGDRRRHGTLSDDEKAKLEKKEKKAARKKKQAPKEKTFEEIEQEVNAKMNSFLDNEPEKTEKLDMKKLGDDSSLEKKDAEKSKPVANAKQQPQVEVNAPSNDK